jgi:GntR family transcriptional regulator
MTNTSASGGAPTRLLRDGPDVLYEQMADRLRELATSLSEGAPLPSESVLMRRYGVSRSTVRKALKTLVAEGLLTSRQGVGTFVARRRVGHPLTELGGFVEAFTRHGLDVQSELGAFGWADDPAALPAGAPANAGGGLVFRRVYRVDTAVWAVADCCVFEPYGADITRADLQRTPSFELLQRRFGSPIAGSEISVGLGGVPVDVATLLGVRPDSPVLRLRRLLSARDGAPVQYAVYHVPADRFEFIVREPVSGARMSDGTTAPQLRLLARVPNAAAGAGGSVRQKDRR